MKYFRSIKSMLLATTLALFSLSVSAQTPRCDINIDNELHLKDEAVSVYQNGQPKVVIDQQNQLYINNEKVDLNQMQQQAVQAYREKIATYIPQAKAIADDGVKLANDVIDDLGDSFNNQTAFNNVKTAIDQFYADIESRYYNDGEWVLQKNAVSQAITNWKNDSTVALQRFNTEFFASAFSVLADKMKTEGSVNLSELQTQFIDLKASVEKKLRDQSADLKKEATNYCTDLKGIAEDEKALHQQIPQLKGYEVFVI